MEQKRTMNRSDVQQVHELEEPLDYMLMKSKLFPDCYEEKRRDYHHWSNRWLPRSERADDGQE